MRRLRQLFRPDAPASVSSESKAEGESAAKTAVPGERGIISVNRAVSLQARLTHFFALGLMAVVGLTLLTWYYTQVFTRPARAATTNGPMTPADAEMALPSLGRLDPPPTASATGQGPVSAMAVGSAPAPALPETVRPPASPAAPVYGAPGTDDRRLSGRVFSMGDSPVSATLAAPETGGLARSVSNDMALASDGSPMSIGALLRPTATPAVRAQVLPTQRLLLPKGTFIDCTLETAIDSSLPGMTTCITPTDTFSADGAVVLLERGTKLTGETRGDVRPGSSRLFVLWTEARTPTGVVIALASPGTDELGRSGLPGEVDRHFFERFGAAILVSVIDGTIQAAAQRQSNSNGAIVVNPSGSRDILTEVLRSTINIPPTVTKPNGDRIQIMVARDLDFRSVYELRATTR